MQDLCIEEDGMIENLKAVLLDTNGHCVVRADQKSWILVTSWPHADEVTESAPQPEQYEHNRDDQEFHVSHLDRLDDH